MKKIQLTILSVIVAVSVLAFPVKQASAAGFLGVPNSIDWNDFFTTLAESTAANVLKSFTDRFVSNAVGRLLSKYQISNYRTYLINVGKQVYLGAELPNSNARETYIMTTLINDAISHTQNSTHLDPLYTQAARQVFDVYSINGISPGTPEYYAQLSGLSNPAAYPAMQKVIDQDAATTAYNNSQKYALADLLGNGSKSSYGCSLPGNAGSNNPIDLSTPGGIGGSKSTPPPTPGSSNSSISPNTINDIKIASCVIQNPAAVINTAINGEINSAFNIENAPPNFSSALGKALSKNLSSIFLNKLIAPRVGTIFK